MKRTEYISPAVEIYSIASEQGICVTSLASAFEDFEHNNIGWDE